MRLFIITGTCGAGKSTVKDYLAKRLDSDQFVCIDTDEVGINWWDYAGTDHEEHFSDACLAEAVRRMKRSINGCKPDLQNADLPQRKLFVHI